LSTYAHLLATLTYPKHFISLALLVSDSPDGTLSILMKKYFTQWNRDYRRVTIIQHDFDFQLDNDEHRHDYHIQPFRRSMMAMSRYDRTMLWSCCAYNIISN
jgi:hypothetical protein